MSADVLTEDDFSKFLSTVATYGSSPKMIFINPKVKKIIDDWARTVVLAETANHAKYELDGRVWWARTRPMHGSSGSWPRYDPEGWDARQIYNRHWRRRGYGRPS